MSKILRVEKIKDQEYAFVEIELAHREMVDLNRRFLSRESYVKAIQDERIRELIKTCMFGIEWGTSTKPYVDPMNRIGIITAINTDENTAILRVDKDTAQILDKNDYVLAFGYMGHLKKKDDISLVNEIINPRIINAGLILKSTSAYQEVV